MSRGLEATGIAGLGVAVLTVGLRDPGEPLAVATFVAAVGVAVAAAVARVLLGLVGTGRSAKARLERRHALRRGASAGVVAAMLLALRAIDGLNLFTAGFVLLAFALAEAALTTRAPAVR